MNQLVNMQVLTMSSREIADLVNSRHDSVRRTIERLSENGIIQPPPLVEVKNHLGQTVWQFEVCKRDSFVVVAQLSPVFTAALVDRWQELENGKPSALPKTFADALRLAADQQEQIEQQAQQLAIAAPKVEFVDRYVEASGLKGFRQVAKLLGIKENLFRAFLVEHKIQYQIGGDWVPYAVHIDAGRFEVKTGTAEHNDHAFTSAKFTPRGIEYVARLLRDSKKIEPEKALGREVRYGRNLPN